jgi:hypothetical protein
MYTSLVLVALAGSSIAAEIPVSLEFRSDYMGALKVGRTDRKPLAVFIGSGPKGWEQRTTDGQFSQETQKLLQANYVCVYLDTATEDGKRLAGDFGMQEGLIFSDAIGQNQAFRHEGKLSNSDLERQLKKFSDPSRVATRTESNVREDVRNYPTETPSGTISGYYAPQQFGGYSSIPSSGYCPSCSSGFRR